MTRGSPWHLLRRFAGSFGRGVPDDARVEWVASQLNDAEFALWSSMRAEDQRHSLVVVERYRRSRPGASRAEHAAALLHDVGKIVANLGTWSRVVATIVGPRTRRFRDYHDHESLGSVLAMRAGSDPVTVAMIRGDARPELLDALRAADDC
jgi:hypothetical protein